MELSLEKLQRIILEAFEGGYNQNVDQDEFIEELFKKHAIDEKNEVVVKQAEDYRIYTVSELNDLPEGTVFNHFTLGQCRVKVRFDNKYMAFDNEGLAPSGFSVDDYPWDIPMKIVS